MPSTDCNERDPPTLPGNNDAKLSGLALEYASYGSAITLSPSFRSRTTGYRATVGTDVDEIIVDPTIERRQCERPLSQGETESGQGMLGASPHM